MIFQASSHITEPLGISQDFEQSKEFRGTGAYFYAEGPEYKAEHIHDRQED